MTQLPKFDIKVLIGIVAYLHDLRSQDGGSYPYGSKQRWLVNIAKSDGIVLVDLPAFLGHVPSRSERNKAPDTYRRLEAAGYIVRLHHAHSDRTCQLRVLPAAIDRVAAMDDTFLPVATYVAPHYASTKPTEPEEPDLGGAEGTTNG